MDFADPDAQMNSSAPTGTAAGADRRLSIARLASSLQRRLSAASGIGPEAQALCVPVALLMARHMRFDAADPQWPDRDRLVVAQGAAGLGEATSALLGAAPGLFHQPGQALGASTGLALAERMLTGRFGRSLVDHRTWQLGGGAELATGPVQEAACLAGRLRLGRLTMIAAVPEADLPGLAGFAANGWAVRRTTAGDAGEVAAALSAAARSFKPTLIVCVTHAAAAEMTPCADGAQVWGAAGRRNAGARRSWLKRLARHASRPDFDRAVAGGLQPGWQAPLVEPGRLSAPEERVSTAQAVQRAIAVLSPTMSGLTALPGDAGWALPSTQAEPAAARELCGKLTQASAAVTAGLALHGGLMTLAVHRLGDVAHVQPALHDLALEGLRHTQIMMEPATPCPVSGQHAALHAMQNVTVFRPADAAEAMECLALAFRRTSGPSVLLLSDAPAPVLAERPARTPSARGGYVVAETAGERVATLVASGAELHLAMQARALLATSGIEVAVVSLPCWTVFAAQDPEWVAQVLGPAPRYGIEASSGFGWERWLGSSGLFIAARDDRTRPSVEPHRIAETISRHLHGREAAWTPVPTIIRRA